MTEPDIPYRTAITPTPATQQVSSRDEQDFSTLESVRHTLQEELDNLGKWDAFDTQESELKIKQQIAVNQRVYDILTPLVQMIEGTIGTINEKYKR